jgi:hypothetical protein
MIVILKSGGEGAGSNQLAEIVLISLDTKLTLLHEKFSDRK